MADEYIRKEDAINALEEKKHEPWYLHKDLQWISGVVEAKDEIKAIEPADVAPVVHSRWSDEMERVDTYHPFAGFETDYYHRCLNCGHRGKGFSWNFCPNCGAKMDAQREE